MILEAAGGVARLTATGALHAAALVASIALAASLARRRGLEPRLVIETHALGVPLAILLARAEALARAFPDFLHDREALWTVVAAPPSPWPALAGVAILLAAMAWASGRPRALLDCLSPGGVLLSTALLADPAHALSRENLAVALIALAGCLASHSLAREGERPGEAGLVAGQAIVIALAVRHASGPIPSLPLVGCAVVLGLLLLSHVLLRVRASHRVRS